MREIKFRAYIESENKVVDVNTIDFDERTIGTMGVNLMGHPFLKMWDFDQVKLMQYTGLKDKNGAEIYERDIYKDCDGHIIEVVWYKDGFKGLYTYRRKYQGEYYTGTTYLELNDTSSRRWGVEVIGNIYENKELMNI